MKELQGTVLESVGTVRNYEQALKQVCTWTKEEKISGGLRAMTPELAERYLEIRGQSVSQSTLNMERQAMQSMMQHVTHRLEPGKTLLVVKSELTQALAGRAYTQEQISLLADRQTDRNALSTQIAHATGLRAHELFTLQRGHERTADQRPALDTKFHGRTGITYTVVGKGGLCREISIPAALAERLEAVRLVAPERITDRGVHYQTHYGINAGQRWSSSFSAASDRALGWSSGAHGLRHSYAQERMAELQKSGLSRDLALETVSQEMGHFRPDITEVYLR